VTGFDMMRLYHGSLGSLAVILQVNFKVLPRPRAQQTVVAQYDALGPAAAAAETVRRSQLLPSAIALLDTGAAEQAGIGRSTWTLLLRCEAPPVAVVRQATRITDAVSADTVGLDVIDDEETERLWLRVNRALSAGSTEDEIAVRIGVAPSKLPRLLDDVGAIASASGLSVLRTVDCGSGLVYVRLTSHGGAIDPLRESWESLSRIGQHAVLLAAPPAVKQGTDVFGGEPAGFAVMRSLKERFDPNRVLNRGRFAGHL